MGMIAVGSIRAAWVEVAAPPKWARLLWPAVDSLRQNHLPLSPQETACLCSRVLRGEALASLPSANPSLARYKYVRIHPM